MNSPDDTAPDATQKATAKEWIGLSIIALPCMLYSMDLTILNLAIPAIAADLQPSASQLLWIIDVYGFMVAGFLMVMGALGDTYGRRLMLLIGAAAFGAMSVVAAFSQTAEQLIVARALLGIAGATLAPSTLSLISNMFRDEHQRMFAISMWIASFSVGAIIGPLVGGISLHYFWWGAAFLVAVPVMLLLLLLGPFLLPEFRSKTPPKLDYASAWLSLFAVICFIFGVKKMAEYGTDTTAVLSILCGLLLAFTFIARQKRLSSPMVDITLFSIPAFKVSILINLLAMMFMFGSYIFFAQYLQLVAGLSVLKAGLWSLPSAIAFTIMSFFNARLTARFSNLQVFLGGLLLSTLGFMGLAFSNQVFTIVCGMVVISVGFTPVVAVTTTYIVSSVPPEKTGIASALSETAAELGGALGIALLGSMATFLYRSRMSTAVPADIEHATQFKTSLASAVHAAKSMSAELSGPLLEVARSTFMTSFHATAVTSAVTLTLLAWLAARVLRNSAAIN